MSILEDYGMTNTNSTRSLILKTVDEIASRGMLANFRSISIRLWGNPNIQWENLTTIWKSERQRLATYWKSTDIKQNLETLCDCGLIDGDEKDGYELTDEGRQAIAAMNWFQALENKSEPAQREVEVIVPKNVRNVTYEP